VFSKQDDALVGWPDAISADSFMNFETNEASFSVELNQALNAHIARMIEDTIPNHEVSERPYNAFRPCEGSHIVLGVDWIAQEGRRPAFYYARLPQKASFVVRSRRLSVRPPGHAPVAFTMDTYSHIIEGMQEDMMALLDEVLPSGVPRTAKERQNGEVHDGMPL